jgi:uncharacterized protein
MSLFDTLILSPVRCHLSQTSSRGRRHSLQRSFFQRQLSAQGNRFLPFGIPMISCVCLVMGVWTLPFIEPAYGQSDPQSARSSIPSTSVNPLNLPSSASPPASANNPNQKPLRIQSTGSSAAKPNTPAKKIAQPEVEQEAPQQPVSRNTRTVRQVNAGAVSLVSGGVDGTYIRIASDMASLLDETNKLRILPIIGRGSLQNIRDVLFLKGIDIGIVQMDAREGLRNTELYDEAVNQMRFIARLYNEEVHILANRDIKDIKELAGKKVNIDVSGSGTNLTAKIIFNTLGIAPEYTMVDQVSAFEKLKTGEIQASVFVAGRPVRGISEFKAEGRFHILPIPFDDKIAEIYLPARLSNVDYPLLVEPGKTVDTLAVGNLLAVYNWPEKSDRYERVTLFVDAMFSKFEEFLKPGRHPKWREVNIAADVPGWKRFKAAQIWLDKAAKEKSAASVPLAAPLSVTPAPVAATSVAPVAKPVP